MAGVLCTQAAATNMNAAICCNLLKSPSKLPLIHGGGPSVRTGESGVKAVGRGCMEAAGGGTLSCSLSLMSVD